MTQSILIAQAEVLEAFAEGYTHEPRYTQSHQSFAEELFERAAELRAQAALSPPVEGETPETNLENTRQAIAFHTLPDDKRGEQEYSEWVGRAYNFARSLERRLRALSAPAPVEQPVAWLREWNEFRHYSGAIVSKGKEVGFMELPKDLRGYYSEDSGFKETPLYTHPAIPEGFQLVPKEPTEYMLNAAVDVDSFKLGDIGPLGFRCSPQQLFDRCYKAMLAAAPAHDKAARADVAAGGASNG